MIVNVAVAIENMNRLIRNITWFLSKNRKIRDLRELPYEIRYERLSLIELIESIALIEKNIIEDVYRYSIDFFSKSGFAIAGELFVYSDSKFRFTLCHPESTRVLQINFINIDPNTIKYQKQSIKLNQFGLINTLECIYPEPFEQLFLTYLEHIDHIFQYAYLSIEKRFVTAFKNVRELLFDNLYNILNVEIERQNKQQLLGEFIFVLTTRENTRFHYFFDVDYLRQLIANFKKKQLNEFSPFDLISSLLVEEAIHTINLLMDIKIGEIAFLSSMAFKSAEEDFRFWLAESHLLDYKEISSYAVFMNDKVILQVSCKREHENHLIEILDVSKYLLQDQFANNIDFYYKYALRLKGISRAKINVNSSKEVAEFIGTIIGKAINESLN
jgi:hypothetical protein